MHHICVIGSGYVGLVSGACFAELGNRVVCLDTDIERVVSLQEGRLPFFETGLEDLVRRNAAAGRLSFTTEYAEGVTSAEFLFMCLPTPPSPNGAADTSILRSALTTLAPLLRPPYPVVVVKSTAPVGTCASLQRLLEKLDSTLSEVPIVSNPEFLREGSAIADFLNPDRVVLRAEIPAAAGAVRALYDPLDAPVLTTDSATSEMIKYASNSFLATKISFVNEVADICERVGADVSVVADGMGLDRRIGKSFLRPGVGYGGSCFPKDTQALAHLGAMHGADPKLLRAVMDVNTHQFKRVLHKLRAELGDLDGATVAVWGLAYKPDTDDVREAPAIEIIRLLEQEGARVRAHDPVAMEKAAPKLPATTMCRDPYDAAEGADAVLLLTEWKEYRNIDLDRVAVQMHTPLLIDGRNVFNAAAARDAGFVYVGVGRRRVGPVRRETPVLVRRG